MAGVPLSKLDSFRDILEENAFSLSGSSHLKDLIFVLKQDQDVIKTEVSGREVSIIFDGSTLVSEVLAIVLRYVRDDWVI